MRIALGSDKSGFLLKEAVKKYLDSQGIAYTDLGTLDAEQGRPYYEVAPAVAKAVQAGGYGRGILVCGTGMGMALVANKFSGIYAACAESVYAARMCRAVNNANILTMGGWIIGPEMGVDMVKAFLETGFTQGLEPWRAEFLTKAYQIVQEMESGTQSNTI
ncbi:MAG TPA: RpiB/LacA/LacB family sugar-phosphate isomerase [Firmicutes bacterium]|nr:RpiB/LacA/LacB family sugar-phosphate isomerase [Bacillota bacterium]